LINGITLNHLDPAGALQSITLDSKELYNTKVLITGSQGMLGGGISVVLANLILKQELNCQLYLASRSWSNLEKFNHNETVNFISNEQARAGDIPFDFIIHCASPSNITKVQSLKELIDINVGYLQDSINFSTKKVVFISSGEVYGGKTTETSTSLPTSDLSNRRNWYPSAKQEAEKILGKLSAVQGFSLDVIRLFHTFGPGLNPNDGRSFGDIIYGAAISKRIILKSTGSQVRSFLYLTDAIRAILMCMSTKTGNRTFNVGSPNPTSIYEFANLVADISGSTIEFREENFEHSPFDEIIPDISGIQSLGWLPEVDLRVAITRTLNWVRG
jgi:UDP-glucuronate decarboxylase